MVSIARKRVMANVAVAGLSILTLLILFVGLIWTFQERIAFQPQGPPYPDESGLRRVDYSAADGQPLFAYLVGDPQTAAGLLLAFHGNADLAVWQAGWASEIAHRTGLMVMLAEYRGYMGLPGRPSYAASQLDAEAAWQFATDSLGVAPDRMAFFGHSLGTAVATELAAKHSPAALLLQSPFTSARDMAGIMVGRRPTEITWRLVSRLHFDTGAQVARLDVPVSVAHGALDRLIPPDMGKAVFAAAKQKGEWLLVPNASHNDVIERGGTLYWDWITRALQPLSLLHR